MKATLGGYRHLVRKSGISSDDAGTRLKEILTVDFPEAFNAFQPTNVEDEETTEATDLHQLHSKAVSALTEALRVLTEHADRNYSKDAQDTLWSVRLDHSLHPDPGTTSDIWDLLKDKVAVEPLDSPYSLVRVINVITHLAACQELTLSDLAERSLHPANG